MTEYYAKFHWHLRSISYKLRPVQEGPEKFRLDWPESNVFALSFASLILGMP